MPLYTPTRTTSSTCAPFSLDAAVFTRAAQDTDTVEHGGRLYIGGLF